MIFIYVLLAILLFGLLVAVHEFGHFITAKLSGVRVNEFAIGMGPAILKKQIGETVYALRTLPFGGFCAMEGEDSESSDPRAFSSRPVLYRIAIVLAGSIMNLISGFLVLSILFAPVKQWYTPTVADIGERTEVTGDFLRSGDTIKSVDGYNVYIYGDIFVGLSRGGDENSAYDIEVLRDGERVLLKGVRLRTYDGTESSADDGKGISFVVEDTSFSGKIKYIFQNGINLIRLVKVGLGDLISGSVSSDDLSGPIGIGKMMADTAKNDISSLLYLLAFISINLGVMNLLPLPALDGGRFVFLLFELVFRHPVPPKYEGYVHAAGLALLMLLMAFVTYNDIVKIFFK